MGLLTEAELVAEAERFATTLPAGSVVTLSGDLGAGKTTFVRAFARAFGAGDVATSPTYGLVHRYVTPRGDLYHVDCYRLRTPDEAIDLDFPTMAASAAVVLVEWPERAEGWLPPVTHQIRLGHAADPDRRTFELA